MMEMATVGGICFGIEIIEFPWYSKDLEEGFAKWWMYIHKYKSSFDVYDEDMNWADDDKELTDDETKLHNLELEKFFKENPYPVTPIKYGSDDYPIYILAVPSSVIESTMGFPEIFKPSSLQIDEDSISKLFHFCTKYNVKIKDGAEPNWLLSSYCYQG